MQSDTAAEAQAKSNTMVSKESLLFFLLLLLLFLDTSLDDKDGDNAWDWFSRRVGSVIVVMTGKEPVVKSGCGAMVVVCVQSVQ